jgi:hypothetical protein
MKRAIFFSTYLTLATFNIILPMERTNLLVINKFTLPFLKNIEDSCGCDDDQYVWQVDNKTLLMLTIEATSYPHNQNNTSSEQYKHKEFKKFLAKFSQNYIQVPQIEEGFTQITSRDYHRLLSHVRVIGMKIPMRNNEGKWEAQFCTPVIIGNTMAYLRHKSLTRDRDHITLLEDFSDAQEVSSVKFEDCKKTVDEIIRTYQ